MTRPFILAALIASAAPFMIRSGMASTGLGAPSPVGAISVMSSDVGTRFTSSALSLAPGSMVALGMQSAGSADAGATGTPPATTAATTTPRFGEAGSLQFNIYGDFGSDFAEAWMAGAQFGISWFFMDNLSLDVQLDQYGFFQDGGDAYGIGPAMLFRYHFLAYESWSLYADAGCGILFTTNSVPSDGSQFNFTPRVGIGASIALTERTRIMTGVRWFHISNANTSSPNPGRDSMEIYAGLSLPF